MSAISTPEVNETFVIAKCNYFVDTHLWPLKTKLDPEGWLGNFSGADRELAIHLLNGFMYFSSHLIDQLFISAFRGLSNRIVAHNESPQRRVAAWQKFIDEVVITYPTGETPSDADSGHLFARRARDLLEIPESRIMSPDNALAALINNACKQLVFVDDFVGSGSQFLSTWHRPMKELSGKSFAINAPMGVEIYYAPLFCTTLALDTSLASIFDRVRLCPAHILAEEYGALNDPSIFWPTSLKGKVRDFIYSTSMSIGLPDTDGNVPTDWQGFGKLGLGIAFEHQIPDATLPLFYTTENSWMPLWRKQP
jgi:hypothetical protein